MRTRQRGIALITAIVLVALATVMAVAIAFSSAMTARRSTATFSVEQAQYFAQGAEALASYVLGQIAAKTVVTPSDPWAQPYGPVEIADEIALEAQVSDEQGKFNLNTLVGLDGKVNQDAVAIFARLLELVEVEPRWATLMADWIDEDDLPLSDGGEDSLYSSLMPPRRAASMTITSVSELLQLQEFGAERFARIAPHVTALPPEVRAVNVCTATAPVLDAFYALSQKTEVKDYTSDPKAFAANRARGGCFPDTQAFAAGIEPLRPARPAADGSTATPVPFRDRITDKSNYFRLQSWVTVGTTRFALYSLLQRNGNGQVRPVMRTFGTE